MIEDLISIHEVEAPCRPIMGVALVQHFIHNWLSIGIALDHTGSWQVLRSRSKSSKCSEVLSGALEVSFRALGGSFGVLGRALGGAKGPFGVTL